MRFGVSSNPEQVDPSRWQLDNEPGNRDTARCWSHLAGAPAATRRGGLVLAGFSSQDAWTGLLQGILGGTDHGRDVEAFERAGKTVVLDFARLDVRIDE